MFKSVVRVERQSANIPWNVPVEDEFKKAFYEKYVITKRFLSEDVVVSDDELLLQRTTYWAKEEDYISFVTEEDPRITSYIEKSRRYRYAAKLVEDITYYNESVGDIYAQPHIFVVFRPGASGNFISNLLEGLAKNQLNTAGLSADGHAHFNLIVERKKIGIDHLALGTGLSGVDAEFFRIEDKIKYYKNKIDSVEYEKKPYVSWTHDFNNILAYKFLFPNSKTLAITANTFFERIVSLVMSVRKNYFSNDDQLPIPDGKKIKVAITKKKLIQETFKTYYRSKKYANGHYDLDLFLMIQGHIDAHKLNMDARLDSLVPYNDDGTDETLSDIKRRLQYSIGISNVSLSTDKISFKSIMENNTGEIVHVLENLLGRKLAPSEVEYVELSLNQYLKNQDQFLISDPIGYIKSLKERADAIVSSFEDA